MCFVMNYSDSIHILREKEYLFLTIKDKNDVYFSINQVYKAFTKRKSEWTCEKTAQFL